jgi:flagellar biosynthetic protein FliO
MLDDYRLAARSRLRNALIAAIVLSLVVLGLYLAARVPEPAGARPGPAASEAASPAFVGPVYPAAGPEEAWPARHGASAGPDSVFLKKVQATLLSLGLICVLAWGVLRLVGPSLLRGAAPSANHRLLRVVERCPLGPQRSLCLVEAAGRYLVVGMTETGMTLLAEIPAEEIEAARAAQATGAEAAPGPVDRQPLKEVLAHYLTILPGVGSAGSRRRSLGGDPEL